MNKIWLIIEREYLTRVRKRSFIALSLLAPLLLAGTGLAIGKFKSASGPETIAVYDGSGLNLLAHLTDNEDLHFVAAAPGSLVRATAAFKKANPKQAGLLDFPAGLRLNSIKGIQLLSKGNASLKRQSTVRKAVDRALNELKLANSGIKKEIIDDLQARTELITVNLDELGGKHNDVGVTTSVAYVLSILVYMFIFIYGVQVMRGVSEEKSNRIMEVMISSVKPFQLMMGKILGIAGVVITQFGLWLALSWAITTVAVPLLTKPDKLAVVVADAPSAGRVTDMPAPAPGSAAAAMAAAGGDEVAPPKPGQFSVWSVLDGLPIGSIFGGFLFFFLGGYLQYSALFAAVGSAVDDQTDAQQFVFPFTVPLILSFTVSINAIINGDPNGPLAFWLSMIPLTSPIAMVMRLPFGVPGWQLLLSGILLIAGFITATWVASRIYRVGILMHGKKVSYKELSRWMFYKD